MITRAAPTVAVRSRWPGGRRLRRVLWAVAPVAGTGAVVGAWWVATAGFGVLPYVLASPVDVVEAFGRMPGYLARQSRVTLVETVTGFGIATVIGLALGMLLAWTPWASRALMPTLVALHSTPKLALAPLLVIALGYGTLPKIVMVVLVCVFPIILAAATGLATTPAELVELARSLSASGWQTFVKVRLPAALPQLFLGLKTAAPLAVIGAAVAELMGATAGLGYTIRVASADKPLVYAALVLLAAMSISLFYLLVGLERLVAPWVRHTTS